MNINKHNNNHLSTYLIVLSVEFVIKKMHLKNKIKLLLITLNDRKWAEFITKFYTLAIK